MSCPKDKERVSNIRILEQALEVIIMDAAIVFPVHQIEDAVAVKRWVDTLRLWVVEAVKRQHIPTQPAFKDLSEEEKVKTILEKTSLSISKTTEIETRKAAASSYLEMETPPGPPPIPPEKADEQEQAQSVEDAS